MRFKYDICIIGGVGHVGLPLGLLFQSKGKKIVLYDVNLKNIKKVNNGIMPFIEIGSKKFIKKKSNSFFATNKKKYISQAKFIIISIGTPIDKNLKPKLKNFLNFFKKIKNLIKKDQILIVRSSVYPGTCKKIINILNNKFKNLAYCPERIVQGHAIKELPKLPQIVSGFSKKAINSSSNLFKIICYKTLITTMLEAELIKLFSNAWRYAHFSISNQFYMICENYNLNFSRVRKLMIDGYERNKNVPLAGFTAGPCLLKDTMQLSAFMKKKFSLGHSAMSVNEGLPNFMVNKLIKNYNLKNMVAGILGLSFKADIDDTRDSLSFKLYNLLKKKCKKVLISDEYFAHPSGIEKNNLIKKSNIVIIAVPHTAYKKLKFPKNKIIVDSWGIIKK